MSVDGQRRHQREQGEQRAAAPPYPMRFLVKAEQVGLVSRSPSVGIRALRGARPPPTVIDAGTRSCRAGEPGRIHHDAGVRMQRINHLLWLGQVTC